MRGVLAAFAAVLMCCGCVQAPAFSIADDAEDRFSPKERIIQTKNNRLCAENGATRAVKDGFFLDFAYAPDAKSAAITVLATDKFDCAASRANRYYALKQVILLLDGRDRIAINLIGSLQSNVKPDCADTSEIAVGNIFISDLEKIANAKKIEAKIIGANRAATFEGYYIDEFFIPRTARFLETIRAAKN
ncbi:MAG: hypothetical protein LBQ52_10430 [Helicobacteraceae bacterium]|jgi:hypothetical protein|nr:hypothetical protein [Helicobacteraceae bacterium]